MSNFLDWHRNLRIVIKHEKKLYVLEQQLPEPPTDTTSKADWDAYMKHLDDIMYVTCLMLATMILKLQRQHENMEAFDIIKHF